MGRATIGEVSITRGFVLVLALVTDLGFACGKTSSAEQLRATLRGFFEAPLNGDVAALDDYVSGAWDQKVEFLKSAEVLRILEEVDVVSPKVPCCSTLTKRATSRWPSAHGKDRRSWSTMISPMISRSS